MYRKHSKFPSQPQHAAAHRPAIDSASASREGPAGRDRMRLLAEDVLDVFLLDEQSVEPEPEHGDFWGVPEDGGLGNTEGIWP